MASAGRAFSYTSPSVTTARTQICTFLKPSFQIRSLHTRHLHSTQRPAAAVPNLFDHVGEPVSLFRPPQQTEIVASAPVQKSPLAKLPLITLLRSIMVQRASSIPALLRPSVAILSFLATTKSPLFSPDRNPFLKSALKALLYNHFCAGENANQVWGTAHGLKSWGVRGILLGWAREYEFRGSTGGKQVQTKGSQTEALAEGEEAIRQWLSGTLRTVQIATPGDLVSLKFSGAGPLVLASLQSPANGTPQSFMHGLREVCQLAKARGISLAIDAEQQRIQPGIDAVAMTLSREYNGPVPGSAVVKNTYQAYLKCTPARLSADLELAAREGFCAGVKLVRGAYLASEPRSLIWDTKEGTDTAYDGLAEGMLRRRWDAGGYLEPASSSSSSSSSSSWSDARGNPAAFPHVDLVLATHNLESVQRAIRIRQAQAERGEQRIRLVYAQLMGMADHVSAAAIEAGQRAAAEAERRKLSSRMPASATASAYDDVEVPTVYKYLVWGSVQECMRYLVRRAEENRDAATRNRESRQMLWTELRRRMRLVS